MALCLALELAVRAGAILFTSSMPRRMVWPIFVHPRRARHGAGLLNPAPMRWRPTWCRARRSPTPSPLNSSAWQIANIVGPAVGRAALWHRARRWPSAAALGLLGIAIVLVLLIAQAAAAGEPHQATSLDTLLAGFRYICNEKIVLGAISLDLFAVLLGGAVALLPVYARDILDAGPWGLGLLRAAPGVGAIVMALWLRASSRSATMPA